MIFSFLMQLIILEQGPISHNVEIFLSYHAWTTLPAFFPSSNLYSGYSVLMLSCVKLVKLYFSDSICSWETFTPWFCPRGRLCGQRKYQMFFLQVTKWSKPNETKLLKILMFLSPDTPTFFNLSSYSEIQ